MASRISFWHAVYQTKHDAFMPCGWVVAFFWTIRYWKDIQGYHAE